MALLDDILEFSQLEGKMISLEPVIVPLAETLRVPADLLRASATQKGIELRVEIADELPSFALLDPARLQRVLYNLLGNAVKFTDRGSVKLRAFAKESELRAEVLRIEVHDTGIGFSEQHQAQLFQRFVQGDASIKGRFGGTGLGLSISRDIVELMGGSMGAQRSAAQGSLFWCELPLVRALAPAASPSAPGIQRLSLLLVEDNDVNRMVLRLMLEKLGHGVQVASNGSQALELAKGQAFDMLLLDLQMPDMDGDEVVRRLRAETGARRRDYIVALTAAAGADQKERFMKAGADALYTKPIDAAKLRGLLAAEGPRALARTRGSQSVDQPPRSEEPASASRP